MRHTAFPLMTRLALAPLVLLLAARSRAQAPAGDAAARETMARATVRATLGPAETPLPLEVSNFLLDHPDLSAAIVRAHGIAPYRVDMRGSGRAWADDGDGTQGLVTLLSRSDDQRLYYGEGFHRSPLFPTIRATAVIAMNVQALRGPDGCERTRTTFTVYVRLRSRFVAGIAKALRPFLERTVAGKFTKAFLVADQVGRLMARDPEAVAADARAFPGLPDADRARLLALIARLPRGACGARMDAARPMR